MDADPFASPDEARAVKRDRIITGGRYRLPNRDGSKKPYGWQRVTNLVSAYSDQFALRMWEIEQGFRGVRASHELYRELLDTNLDGMDKDTRKLWTEDYLERCKSAAGANAGRDFGNHAHAVVEADHAALPLGVQGAATRRMLSLYASALIRHKLYAVPGMQERRVLVEELEACGTLDNILEDVADQSGDTPGRFYVGDLKTQKRFWTFLEIGAQLACYAHAVAIWDAEAGAWRDMPQVDLETALVLWMPREHPSGEPQADVYNVDIVAGWKTAKRAYEVVKDRSAAKSTRNPRGWLRPAPPVSETERYAALFTAVDSMTEGSALVAEIHRKGLWSAELADCARLAVDRLTKNVVK